MESLGRLPGIYGCDGITAGNAPGLNDGATAILFMTRQRAADLGLEVLGEIKAMNSIAIDPNRLPEGPGFAIGKLLDKTGLGLDDLAVMEINEAFAAVPLVSLLILAGKDKAKAAQIAQKTNINGGAIAVGHPNTASGARLIMNLLYELRRRAAATPWPPSAVGWPRRTPA
jgi:acetyl-CoA C-acetyltransferase